MTFVIHRTDTNKPNLQSVKTSVLLMIIIIYGDTSLYCRVALRLLLVMKNSQCWE